MSDSRNDQSGLAVTEDDLAYAAAIWRAMRLADDEATSVAAIATSLAAERERARAPFLALADELENDESGPGFDAGPDYWAGLLAAADRIRRAAEAAQ